MKSQKHTRQINILSIDGGGIRGIIPAMVLAEIERLTEKPIVHLFDLIAGTSTGALIALGLTKDNGQGRPQYSAENIVRLYETEGPQVFARSIFHTVKSLDGLIDSKYSPEGTRTVFNQYFGTARLRDALVDVLIPAYDIESRTSYFFKSTKAREEGGEDFAIADVARAAAAAPTYFEPVKLQKQNTHDYLALIDGGIFANNPALAALIEAYKYYPKVKEFVLVSLGTGQMTRCYTFEKVKHWGKLEWAVPILETVFDGSSDTVDYHVRKLLPQSGKTEHYYRFQVELTTANDDLDDASAQNLANLKNLATQLIINQKDRLKSLSSQLQNR